MAFLGNNSITQSFVPAVDYFTADGSTLSYTLSRPVASVAQVEVVVNNVVQNPSDAYTVNGNTITFTSAPAVGSTNNVYVKYTSPITQVVALPQDPVVYGNLNLNTVGGKILGDFTASGIANGAPSRIQVQTTAVNGVTHFSLIPNGSGIGSVFQARNNSDAGNASFLDLRITNTEASVASTQNGTGALLPLVIQAGGTERMRFGTDGLITIPSGQIKFPATQNPSADPNTLDDYEEGTFTATINYSTVNTTGSTNGSATQSCIYRKIGNLVYITFASEFNMSNVTSGLFVAVNITGLPFASTGTNALSVSGYGLAGHYSGTMASGGIQNPNISGGGTTIYPRYTDYNGGSGWLCKTGTTGNCTFFISGCYTAA